MAFLPNPKSKPFVDHIDNNKENNNVINLRMATKNENVFNTKLYKTNILGYKGISYKNDMKKYRARIFMNGKECLIGYYANIDEAVIARYKKAKELQGEYINQCEENQYNIILLKKQKEKELKEIEELELEFMNKIK